ncbi:carbamoyltransferase HypF [Hydrogenimonas sp.]
MRWHCRITGLVQGVGFRPTVYRYATQLGLAGWVRNDGGGVTLEVEGDEAALRAFVEKLEAHPPPLARIDAFEVKSVAARGEGAFVIVASEEAAKAAPVTPDMSVCDACLEEMRNPADRRHGYPFINCTDCGPRYTITRTVPYDRPHTSMAKFSMCEACRAEYEDPAGRRYHAQPIACPQCGPAMALNMENGELRIGGSEAIAKTAELLKAGKIVAVKGLGGFHLMCDATNDEAVRRLRERKRRPSKPFALMVKDLAMAKALCDMDEKEETLLASKERPIVLLKKRGKTSSPNLQSPIPNPRMSDSVAPGIDRLGLMLPYTPLHYLLFDHLEVPLVATSANLSDEPIIRDYGELMARLGRVVDAVLDHDRDIVNACDDSVAQVIGGEWVQWLRVARGVAPLTLPLQTPTERRILAVGAQQKSTLALAFDRRIVLSPHIGDLHGIEAMEYFERTVETFRRFYDFTPDTVVGDLHPGYETTKWAQRRGLEVGDWRLEKVQHHFAHVLAAMAEHGVTQKVLAFAWDGTGYGTDATVWGGEVLLADAKGFKRLGHLRPFRLLGGEKAVKEPRRSALALLFELFSLEEILAMQNPTVQAFAPGEIRLLHQAWRKGLGAPVTTSMGRLFDAVASLAGVCQRVGYEGEAGLLLEAAVFDGNEKSRTKNEKFFELTEEGVIDWEPLVRRLAAGETAAAGGFIPALAQVMVAIAHAHPHLPIVLAGGVFQNRTLCEAVMPRLKHRRLLLPRHTPVNDGAIALGQAWYALAMD